MIIIEGNIGAGKTTLAMQIKAKLGTKGVLMLEPVVNNPYLDKFYRDKRRWGLEMQYWLMAKRYMMHKEAIEKEWTRGVTTVFDRSIYGDWPFAYTLFKDGLINKVGYDSYMGHRKCMESTLLMPHTVIYLDVSPEKAKERIEKRGRECEQDSGSVPLDYLVKLKDAYDELINELKAKTNVAIVDWKDGMTVDNIDLQGTINHCGLWRSNCLCDKETAEACARILFHQGCQFEDALNSYSREYCCFKNEFIYEWERLCQL